MTKKTTFFSTFLTHLNKDADNSGGDCKYCITIMLTLCSEYSEEQDIENT